MVRLSKYLEEIVFLTSSQLFFIKIWWTTLVERMWNDPQGILLLPVSTARGLFCIQLLLTSVVTAYMEAPYCK